MDSKRFDRLSRLVGSRRRVGLALGASALLGLADAATAKKGKKKNCKKFRIKVRCNGTSCGSTKVRTCGKKFVRCKCRAGTTCLPNESCGLSCEPECPEGCFCAEGGEQVCLQSTFVCDEAPACSSTADCRFGTACTETECGPEGAIEKRCVPLCDLVS